MVSSIYFWLGALSLTMFLGGIVVAPIAVGKLPADYFARATKDSPKRESGSFTLWRLFRNGMGILLILTGIALLVLPGQGLLTVLIGLAFVDIPGKHRAVQWVVRKPGVMRVLNELRRRVNKPPFEALERELA